MGANFAGLCENVNNFSKDGIFTSDNPFVILNAQFAYRKTGFEFKIKILLKKIK